MSTSASIPESLSKRVDDLEASLDAARDARACISQNRGYEREQAREGYEHAVGELAVAREEAVRELASEIPDRDVERLAVAVLRVLRRSCP